MNRLFKYTVCAFGCRVYKDRRSRLSKAVHVLIMHAVDETSSDYHTNTVSRLSAG